MASGPYFSAARGTWSIQYFDGKWHRIVVMRKPIGWTPDKGAPKKTPSFVTDELKRYAKIEEDARKVRSSGMPSRLDAFLGSHVQSYRNEKTKLSVKKTVNGFLEWCESKDVSMFSHVTPDICAEWLEHLGRSLKVTTIRTRRAQLIAAWSKVCKRKAIVNPWHSAEVQGKPESKKRGAWSKEDFDKLLEVSRPWLRDVLVVGVHTGLRINALVNLEWDHVDTKSGNDKGDFGFVKVPPHLDKAKKGYDVPIGRKLHDVLMRRRMTTKGEFVLLGQNGRQIKGSSGTAQAIVRACKKAGLRKPDSPNHHMRRTFGRWAHFGHLTGASIPIYVVMMMLGHASTIMTMKYLDIKEHDLAKYMRESPQFEG